MQKLNYSVEELQDEFEFVDDLNESLWVTPGGELLTGDYDMGVRGLDHRGLLDFYDLDREDIKAWDKIHEIGFVRIVPETQKALIYDNQPLTEKQKTIIEEKNFDYEVYGELKPSLQQDKETENLEIPSKDIQQSKALDKAFLRLLNNEISEDYYKGMRDITVDKQSPILNHEYRQDREKSIDNAFTISNYLEKKNNIKTTIDLEDDTLKTSNNKLAISFEEINKEPEKSLNRLQHQEKKLEIDI